MSALYPLHLDVHGRRVLVVGAGRIATRRVESLLDAGADVVVVAPEATERIASLAAQEALVWRRRAFDYSDVIGAWLVHTAARESHVNDSVAAEAARRGVWCVRADRPGAARTPSVTAVDGITVSVTSGDPQRTRVVRDTIAAPRPDASANTSDEPSTLVGLAAGVH